MKKKKFYPFHTKRFITFLKIWVQFPVYHPMINLIFFFDKKHDLFILTVSVRWNTIRMCKKDSSQIQYFEIFCVRCTRVYFPNNLTLEWVLKIFSTPKSQIYPHLTLFFDYTISGHLESSPCPHKYKWLVRTVKSVLNVGFKDI